MEATGDCYRANGNRFVDLSNENGPTRLRLVHGIVATGSGHMKGVRHGHCWIEDGDVVTDCSDGSCNKYEKQLYYAIGNIQEDEVRHYDVKQFAMHTAVNMHWGPWEVIDEKVTT